MAAWINNESNMETFYQNYSLINAELIVRAREL